MFNKIARMLVGDPNKREIEKSTDAVDQINALENEYEALSDAELLAKTDEFRSRLEQDETLDDLLVEAFAAVREASKRTLGLRHYDVQLIGGIALHQKDCRNAHRRGQDPGGHPAALPERPDRPRRPPGDGQ